MAKSAPRFSTIHNSGQLLLHRNPKRALGKIRAALVERVRADAGPGYAIIDSQSVKTTSAAEERGIDGGKKQKDANGTRSGYYG